MPETNRELGENISNETIEKYSSQCFPSERILSITIQEDWDTSEVYSAGILNVQRFIVEQNYEFKCYELEMSLGKELFKKLKPHLDAALKNYLRKLRYETYNYIR